MTSDAAATATLMTWLSPAFPVGGFAWSGGLEAAVAGGMVTDRDSLMEWLTSSLERGTARLDTMAVGLAVAGVGDNADVDDTLLAMATTPERASELREMGHAFWAASAAWRDGEVHAPMTYPIAFGVMARGLGADRQTILTAFCTSLVSAQIQAALRLLPLGQKAGVECLAGCAGAIESCCVEVANSTLDDLSTSTFAVDIAAMQHRDLPSRIFRS
ncbi:MAG: urease accessory UreF family protein [Pseudomonadota bacterium]